MAEALVSVVLEELGSILVEQVKAEVNLVVGVEDEVQKLTSNFTAIKAVLEDAENRQVKENAVRDWLDKLKDISYDIHDVVDEWNTAVRKLHMKKIENASNFKKKVRSLIPTYRFSPKQLVLRHDIATKIKNVNKTLDNIAKEKDMFGFSLRESTRVLERQITTSVVDLSNIHGRDEDKDGIVDLLLSQNSHGTASLPIISIVGMGGLGKTTLARLVYHDDRVKIHFDKKIWVCVSDPFDEMRIARAILESLQGVASNLVEYETLLHNIGQIIENKRFLLVLDDVWTEDSYKWEQLKNSLKCGSQESRILLTARKENVAKVVGTTNMIALGKLPEEECWSLFSQVAFFERATEECKKLEDIGRKIVSKCNGLPLAVKTLGSLLRQRTSIEQWQSVLDSEMWKIEEIEKGLFPPLLLSYYDLPSNMRKCFSYCAIFPKDYKIDKDRLIKLWMAQGYLRIERREDMELIGEEYFENLAMRSFFQDFERSKFDGGIISCKMHDIVHDFAQFLTKNECFTIEGTSCTEFHQLQFFNRSARHAMVMCNRDGTFVNPIYNVTKLRSLVFCNEEDCITDITLGKLFDNLTCLRTLEVLLNHQICIWSIPRIPRTIKKLKHLRYLKLSNNWSIRALPEEVCDLYNLQILDVSNCGKLRKLPGGIGKLINLRHLINDGTPLSYMPKGFGRLTSLRTLSKFPVSEVGTLECLKNLKHLQGSLTLARLENVSDGGDAENAQLASKKKIVCLHLEFKCKYELRFGELTNRTDEVLEALQPSPYLEKLQIDDYLGNILFPSWLMSLTKLRMLTLRNCQKCEHLPPLGRLPSLESLNLYGLGSVKKLGNEFLGFGSEYKSLSSQVIAFPKLKYIEFDYMLELKEWDNYEIMQEKEIEIMPCLCELEVNHCYELKALPDYLL